MTADLDPIERALLAQIAGGDEGACDVLADHWAGHGDPARGAFLRIQRERAAHPEDPGLRAAERELLERHGERWLAPALAAGFPRDALVLERGFLRAVPVVSEDEDAAPLLRLSPVIYRELGRADCNGCIFEARAVTADGETDRVLLKTIRPEWPEKVYDDDVRHPSAINRMAMRGYALRRDVRGSYLPEGEPLLGLALPGGVHLSSVLGVRSRSDPEDGGPRPVGRRLGLAFAISVAHAACRALAALHEANEAHRQITPENILLGEHGGLHLLDLYPSRRLFDTFMPWSHELILHASSEQARGLPSDARSDVFSLALVMCTLIDGQHPVGHATTGFGRITAIVERQLELPPRLPAAIGRVVGTALEHPDHRYPSAALFADALADAAAQARIPHGPDVIATTLACLPAMPGPAGDPDDLDD